VSDAAGSLDLGALADVVGTASLLVSGDTGVAHLATAFGTPSVTLFGPTPPSTWGPAIDLDRHTVLWHGHPDRPGDPHGDRLDPALATVTVDEVLDACERLLDGFSVPGGARGTAARA
jgi:ADP-heptose:LPS heptosyltransferase